MLVRIEQKLRLISAVLLAGVLVVASQPSFADASLLKKADQQILVKKFKSATRTLTKAMNSGDLSDKQMAQALYRRGVANNGAGRYSSAIADITGALWLGKLDSTARTGAYRQRGQAYEAVGYKKLANRDFGKSGQRPAGVRTRPVKSRVAAKQASISSFDTVVRAVRDPTPPTRIKSAPRPAVAKKVAIPAFRTSVATE